MIMEKGRVVQSIAGRDKDRFYLVIQTDAKYAWIADGKRRKVERPKRKNPIHLRMTRGQGELNELTNRRIRALLRNWNHQ